MNIAIDITPDHPLGRSSIAHCGFCGQRGRSEARFCWNCGKSLGIIAPYAPPVTCIVAARTDRGCVREQNEDTVYGGMLALPDGETAYLSIVADGMGGQQAGEQASWIAAAVTWTQLYESLGHQDVCNDADCQALLRAIVCIANRRVYESAKACPEWHGMGSTLTVALVVAGRAHIASVGDSRAYRISAINATATQLTTDHTVGARLVEEDYITRAELRDHPLRHVLYSSLGSIPLVAVDTHSVELCPGDRLLLCSDGLTEYVCDYELARIALAQPNPACACEQLVALANARGGEDNVSVVVMGLD